ncbi:MAG: response regulator [Elusimicrobiota bacterium]
MAKKIMTVDDEPFLIEMLKITLVDAGFEVIAVSEGTKVVSKAREEKPDLISLDVNMPDKDGLEICKELKADPATRHIPVIFLSAFTQDADIQKGLAAGAAQYLTKPLSMINYVALIKRTLNVE